MGVARNTVTWDPPPSRLIVQIAQDVCDKYRIRMRDLRGPSQARAFSVPRQEFMARAHATRSYSTPQIGSFLNGRDHTTVLAGIRAHEARNVDA